MCRYSLNERLNEVDKSTLMMALYFHPHRDEKIGVGAQDIKVFSIEDETVLGYKSHSLSFYVNSPSNCNFEVRIYSPV